METEEAVQDLTPRPATALLDDLAYVQTRRADTLISWPYDILLAVALECLPQVARDALLAWTTERLSDASHGFSVSYVVGDACGFERIECGGFILRKRSAGATLLRRVYPDPMVPFDFLKDEWLPWFTESFVATDDTGDSPAPIERWRAHVTAVFDDAMSQVVEAITQDLGRSPAATSNQQERETAMSEEVYLIHLQVMTEQIREAKANLLAAQLSPGDPVSGRRPRSRSDRIAAVKEWDALPKDGRGTLDVWLEAKFATNEDGSLRVPASTFHSWRRLKNS